MPSSPVARRRLLHGRAHSPHSTAGPTGFPLSVDGGEHEGDVGGEEVVHLVAQTGLTQEATTPHQTANGHVEVVGAATPVGDFGERVNVEDFLRHKNRLLG